MTSRLWWYTARSCGLVAWGLLAASMVAGLALSTRALGRRVRSAWLLDLHRFLGGAAVVFVGIHVVSILLDSYVHFGLVEVLVPFAGDWHPVAVGWGITSLYLLLAIELTSLVRDRLPKRVWRLTHSASFPLFALATTHALTAGTDRTRPLMRAGVLFVAALVAIFSATRIGGAAPEPARR